MRKKASDRAGEWIAGLIEARQAVLNSITALSEQKRDAACIGTWSVKELLAHLTGWDFTNLQAIQEIQSGQYPSFFQYYDKDWQSYNAHLVAEYGQAPFEALLANAQSSHQQLVAYLQSLPTETLLNGKARSPKGRTVTIRNLLQSEIQDETAHAGQVSQYFSHANQHAHAD